MSSDENRYTDAVRMAHDAISGLTMGEEYKLTAFKLILERELGRPVASTSVQGKDTDNGAAHPTPSADWQKKVAGSLGITEEQVLDLYHMNDDGEIELVIEINALPDTAAKATKHIAMLYAGGRQAAGTEKATSIEKIREVCEVGFKVVDKKNFSTNINKLGSKFRVSRTGSEKTVMLINGAYRQVGEVAKEYVGDVA